MIPCSVKASPTVKWRRRKYLFEYCTPYFKFQTLSNIVYMSALEMVVGCTVAVGRVGSKYFWRVKGGTTLM